MKIDRYDLWSMMQMCLAINATIIVYMYFGEKVLFFCFWPSLIWFFVLIMVLSLDKVLKRDFNQRGFLSEDKKP